MRARSSNLSDRELRCLVLVVEHLSSKEIAVRLGISPHTVDQHVRRALHRLGTPTRREAARWLRQTHERNFTDWRERKQLQKLESSERIEPASATQWPARIRLPLSTARHPRNTMGVGVRLMWILAIAVTAMASSLVYFAGLEGITGLTR